MVYSGEKAKEIQCLRKLAEKFNSIHKYFSDPRGKLYVAVTHLTKDQWWAQFP